MGQSLFAEVPQGPSDPMFVLKQASDSDTSLEKIDVGIGVYRSEKPGYHEFEAVAKAKVLLGEQPVDHEYNPTTGISSFVDAATKLVFGDLEVLSKNCIASVQTVGGTGAVRLAAAFMNRNYPTHSPTARLPNVTKVYVGTPAWPNYVPLLRHAGFEVETFRHYNPNTKSIDLESALRAIDNAPQNSIFILQVCCHNPTGQDYSQSQWRQLAQAMKPKLHFTFFDMAYQGFSSNMEVDAWPVRYFISQNLDLLVCQSFSKHMGLYAERIGALHVVCNSQEIAANVKDQLRSIVRWEVSSTPAYGAKLADIILHDNQLRGLWLREVQQACDRMTNIRRKLYSLLVNDLRISGGASAWSHILHEKGLFSYMNLDKIQVARLGKEHHIYLAESGRVNVAGLNDGNVERFARAVKQVVDGDVGMNQHNNSNNDPVASDTSYNIVQSRL